MIENRRCACFAASGIVAISVTVAAPLVLNFANVATAKYFAIAGALGCIFSVCKASLCVTVGVTGVIINVVAHCFSFIVAEENVTCCITITVELVGSFSCVSASVLTIRITIVSKQVHSIANKSTTYSVTVGITCIAVLVLGYTRHSSAYVTYIITVVIVNVLDLALFTTKVAAIVAIVYISMRSNSYISANVTGCSTLIGVAVLSCTDISTSFHVTLGIAGVGVNVIYATVICTTGNVTCGVANQTVNMLCTFANESANITVSIAGETINVFSNAGCSAYVTVSIAGVIPYVRSCTNEIAVTRITGFVTSIVKLVSALANKSAKLYVTYCVTAVIEDVIYLACIATADYVTICITLVVKLVLGLSYVATTVVTLLIAVIAELMRRSTLLVTQIVITVSIARIAVYMVYSTLQSTNVTVGVAVMIEYMAGNQAYVTAGDDLTGALAAACIVAVFGGAVLYVTGIIANSGVLVIYLTNKAATLYVTSGVTDVCVFVLNSANVITLGTICITSVIKIVGSLSYVITPLKVTVNVAFVCPGVRNLTNKSTTLYVTSGIAIVGVLMEGFTSVATLGDIALLIA